MEKPKFDLKKPKREDYLERKKSISILSKVKSEDVHNGMSLKTFLEIIPKQINYEDVRVRFSYDDHNDYEIVIYDITTEITIKEDLEKYKKDMQKYQEGYDKFLKDSEEYEKEKVREKYSRLRLKAFE